MKMCLKQAEEVAPMVAQMNDDLIGAVISDIKIVYYDAMNAVIEMTIIKDGVEYQLNNVSIDWDKSTFVIERVEQ